MLDNVINSLVRECKKEKHSLTITCLFQFMSVKSGDLNGHGKIHGISTHD